MSFRLSLKACCESMGATLQGADVVVTGVSIDTRTLKAGDLYVAIAGERYDGHQFIARAESAGASAVVAHTDVRCGLPILRVSDTRVALGQLARYWAAQLQVPTVAITGSNGKTTVKEILASILRQLGPVLATSGNLNNEIGVPLTLLRLREDHLYAVVEMGANHKGEIARLVDIARPDVAVITNIGRAHLEGFGSLEGIAEGKSELFGGLSSEGYAVINADDVFADTMRQAASHCRIREFGLSEQADVQGLPDSGLKIRTMDRLLTPRFALSGDHNGMNALASVAAAQCLDVPLESIVRGLEKVQAVPGRLQRAAGVGGCTVIDDSYNANPDSVKRGIDVLAKQHGQRFLVLGDMAELGADAMALHAEVGEYARAKGIDAVFTVGELSRHAQTAFNAKNSPEADSVTSDSSRLAGSTHFASREMLLDAVKPLLNSDVTLLVKGSRSAGMDFIARSLVQTVTKPEGLST